MSEVSAQVAAIVSTIEAGLPEVDSASTAGYLPAVDTQNVALIATALGHADDGYYYSAGWMHVVHRVRLEFWVKFDVGDAATCIALTRNIGYRAMRALVAADVTGGYTLAASGDGAVMTGSVDPTPLDPGNSGIPFLRYTLTVPVMQKETV
jgi:hypothetical protein